MTHIIEKRNKFVISRIKIIKEKEILPLILKIFIVQETFQIRYQISYKILLNKIHEILYFFQFSF